MVLSPILSHESVSESGIAYADGGFPVKDVGSVSDGGLDPARD